MKSYPILFFLLAMLCLPVLLLSAGAAQVDCDGVYCFTPGEFSTEDTPLTGICVTGLPDNRTGTVLLGNRVLREGDILTTGQVAQLTFHPLRTETDAQAVISYLPIYENRVEKAAVMTINIRGKEDKAPQVQDISLQTYKNVPNEGALKATDPEGQALTYTIIRSPKRGTVELNPDGTFVYTPKKNKVGVDSFVYTATDPAGNVSKPATVTVEILKPSVKDQYTDTVGQDCRFEAEWLRNTGLFVGEQVGGNTCFQPEKAVSREEFLTMVVKMLNLPLDDGASVQLPADAPQWLKPYLAAAQRSGLLTDWQETADLSQSITGAEAAVMLQNALDLTISEEVLAQVSADDSAVPAWAASSLAAMRENGIRLEANDSLTRAQVAQVMYQASVLAETAPGMTILRMQQ